MARILYIAGYGRSGSTLLAAVLGNHPEIASPGELAYALDEWSRPERRCSCGAEYRSCDFWAPLARDPLASAGVARAVRATERLSGSWRLALRRERDGARTRSYRAFHDRLFAHVLERSGKSLVVDSSKSARWTFGRAPALRRLGGHEVYVLHLVRDGRGVVHSLADVGGNWTLEGRTGRRRLAGARATLGWLSANAGVSWLGRSRTGRERYLRLRFEDFLRDPEASLARIGGLIGVDMSPLLGRVREGSRFPVGHMVGGNRLRFAPDVVLDPSRPARRSLPARRRHRILFAVLAGWLNRRYGYGRSGRSDPGDTGADGRRPMSGRSGWNLSPRG